MFALLAGDYVGTASIWRSGSLIGGRMPLKAFVTVPVEAWRSGLIVEGKRRLSVITGQLLFGRTFLLVKAGVKGVEIFAVQTFGSEAQTLAKALVMDNFTFPQKF